MLPDGLAQVVGQRMLRILETELLPLSDQPTPRRSQGGDQLDWGHLEHLHVVIVLGRRVLTRVCTPLLRLFGKGSLAPCFDSAFYLCEGIECRLPFLPNMPFVGNTLASLSHMENPQRLQVFQRTAYRSRTVLRCLSDFGRRQ